MKLGIPEISLKVESIQDSLSFYQALGFGIVEGAIAEKWSIVENSGLRIGLYEGHIESNSLTFFGGDVAEITEAMKKQGFDPSSPPTREEDGSLGATILDPDGNRIYLNN